ncbi:hypothetical protein [Streptomyces sp. PTY087I2]|uniref:hypothetical protein n=1 Tax=Streptomyces sp. PTY087I2 TaxID=1819298 RepID=UPI00080B4AAE|nr:hypothetical protein [Streptomyces sp. PTY087I2]OCC14052.1 hypothetical protein A3Q37_00325 [Streptomyces sp. PTY087I2]
MAKTKRTTELPLAADVAARLARNPEVMAFVMSPVLQLYRMDVPRHVEVGAHGRARLWWFGVIPGWTHHIIVRGLDSLEICTEERGGPVRIWRHRLTFVPLGERRCRYTDEVETEDGWRGAPVRLFIRLMFRHRHQRWHRLARMVN